MAWKRSSVRSRSAPLSKTHAELEGFEYLPPEQRGRQSGLKRNSARCTPRNGVKGPLMFATIAKKPKTPQYRERAGYSHAIVTVTDSHTAKRKDYWLGEMDSPSSREMYHRVIAEWKASGRRLPPPTDVPKPAIHQLTINEVMLAYKRFVDVNFKPASQQTIYMALRVLRQFFGTTVAADFGPNRLLLIRDQMVTGDLGANPPRIHGPARNSCMV